MSFKNIEWNDVIKKEQEVDNDEDLEKSKKFKVLMSCSKRNDQ